MTLQLVDKPIYSGMDGVLQVRCLQQALTDALQEEDWNKVRHLDQTCSIVVNRIIAANQDDSSALVMVLSELKGVYANLIMQCQREVALMAR